MKKTIILLSFIVSSIFVNAQINLDGSGGGVVSTQYITGDSLDYNYGLFDSITVDSIRVLDLITVPSLESSSNINIPNGYAYKQNNINLLRIPALSSTSICVGNSGNQTMTGTQNVYIGVGSGSLSTTAEVSVAIGSYAMGGAVATGNYNTCIGSYSGNLITSGTQNTLIGANSGKSLTTGGANILIGNGTGFSSNFSDCILIGYLSGYNNTGNRNYYSGYASGRYATTATNNVFLGYTSYGSNVSKTGGYNIGFGTACGFNLTSGSNNFLAGYQSGYSLTTGSGNIFLGYQSGYSETGSNKLYIENSNSTNPLIYGDFDNDTLRINGTLDVIGDSKYIRRYKY